MQDIRSEILDKLEEIEKEENVEVLYAVESGSRAWGVESPDSDYDVRFVYVRPKEEYLKLKESKDVIEWQLDEVLDINGWDLKKTLVQFHKGNATLFEWGNSPVVYKVTEKWEKIYKVAKEYFSSKVALHHYYGTANNTFKQYLQGEEVKYKKYIYALRPLLACKYIEENSKIPPVRFEELLKLPILQEVLKEIEKMLEIKGKCDEKALSPRLPVIHNYIEGELIRYEQILKNKDDDRIDSWESLEKIFLDILG